MAVSYLSVLNYQNCFSFHTHLFVHFSVALTQVTVQNTIQSPEAMFIQFD